MRASSPSGLIIRPHHGATGKGSADIAREVVHVFPGATGIENPIGGRVGDAVIDCQDAIGIENIYPIRDAAGIQAMDTVALDHGTD